MKTNFRHQKCVLIVEDDIDLREIFSLALELEGHRVLQAENGQDALELLLSTPEIKAPDCIVTDIKMPVMDGHTFLQILHKRYSKEFGQIPVVVCSAQGEYSHTKQVVEKIDKPTSLEKFCEVVSRALLNKIQIESGIPA